MRKFAHHPETGKFADFTSRKFAEASQVWETLGTVATLMFAKLANIPELWKQPHSASLPEVTEISVRSADANLHVRVGKFSGPTQFCVR
ncbi:MAG: hypothetical protein ACTHLK_09385 [Brucella intermedia]